MEIKRDCYLNMLISKKHNGLACLNFRQLEIDFACNKGFNATISSLLTRFRIRPKWSRNSVRGGIMAGINVTIKPEIISWVLQTVQFENVASSGIELLNKWQSGEKNSYFQSSGRY